MYKHKIFSIVHHNTTIRLVSNLSKKKKKYKQNIKRKKKQNKQTNIQKKRKKHGKKNIYIRLKPLVLSAT